MAVGGALEADILCKTCNNGLNRYIDEPYKEQFHIKLARHLYDIEGRHKRVPHPFPGIHTVSDDDGPLRIKLKANWQPYIVPTAPTIEVTSADSISISVSCDESDRSKLPDLFERSLRRFFLSAEGIKLAWSADRIESEIARLKLIAVDAPVASRGVGGELHGQATLRLQTNFLEHVKAAYEIACLHGGDLFASSGIARPIREFLYDVSRGLIDEDFDWRAAAVRLGVFPLDKATHEQLAPELPPNLEVHHVAIVGHGKVIVIMLGFGVVLLGGPSDAAVHINDIRDQSYRLVVD